MTQKLLPGLYMTIRVYYLTHSIEKNILGTYGAEKNENVLYR